MELADALNLADLEQIAGARAPTPAWDYYRSGAHDEVTLRRNCEAWSEISLHYRVLVDVSRRSTAATILGHELASPVVIAPTAFHRLVHPDGELATARAASATGSAMILSSLSNTAIEDVAPQTDVPLWFQLYVYRDRRATEELVARVEAAGAQALFVTADAPLLGRRERDVRNRFALPPHLGVRNLLPSGYEELPADRPDSGLASYFQDLIDPALSWTDLAWLRSLTDLPIVLKGVVRPDDALRAVDAGLAGVVVSNHGGRQLDTSPATAEVLGPIASAVNGQLELLVDGGVRRGTDVIKAIALGASGVLLGRPILWGLAAGGQAGVERALGMVRDELDLALALCGCPDLASLGPDLLHPGAGV